MTIDARRLPQRIKLARDEADLSQSELGARVGKKKQTVSKWEQPVGSDSSSQPKLDILIQISRITGVSTYWLLTGEGEMYSASGVRPPSGKYQQVSIMKTALSELGGPEAAAQAETILVSSESGNPEDLIAFDITDLANSPEIQIGDTIVVNREETPQPGDFAAVKLSDNTIMFRRLRFLAIGVSGPQVVLEAINPDFAPMTVTLGKDATVLGVMVEQARHTRGSQRVSVFRPAVS